ncbi:hypothetical protein JCM10450v2_002111 [Rhodotorula kratochvilovae]
MPLPDASHHLYALPPCVSEPAEGSSALLALSSFPFLPDVHAWIEVEGAPLQVFGVEQDGSKVVAYIEAKDGAAFEVHYLDLRTSCQRAHVARLYVDGSRVNGMVVKRQDPMFEDPPDGSSRECIFKGSKCTRTTIRPFEFNSLQVTDNDDLACSDERVVKNIGTIQIKYMRVKNPRSTDTFKPKAGQMPSIHEKAKKAQLSHQVGFGDPVDVPAGSRLLFDLIDREDDPLSMLEFRYRSRALLEAQGIVDAPSPSNTPPQRASPSPSLEILPAGGAPSHSARLAALEEELAELERDKRITQVKREIALLKEGEGGARKRRKIGGEEEGGGGKGKGKARCGEREGSETE